MTWPSQEQFDKASELGHEYALQEFSNGSRAAQESPLSGEWADGITLGDIARNVEYQAETTEDFEAVSELGNAWETGYNDAWTHSLPIPDRFLTVEIRMENSAMKTGDELATALRGIADRLADTGSLDVWPTDEHIVKDVNGQTVGTWQIEERAR